MATEWIVYSDVATQTEHSVVARVGTAKALVKSLLKDGNPNADYYDAMDRDKVADRVANRIAANLPASGF